MNSSPIAPELLDYVNDYVDESDLNTAIDIELESDSNLILFCRELFGQLFANVIGEPITGIGEASAQRANILRRKNRRGWPNPLTNSSVTSCASARSTQTCWARGTAGAAILEVTSTSSSCQPSSEIWKRGLKSRH